MANLYKKALDKFAKNVKMNATAYLGIEDEEAAQAVNDWLDTVNTHPTIHVLNILKNSLWYGGTKRVMEHTSDEIVSLLSTIVPLPRLASSNWKHGIPFQIPFEILAALMQRIQDPNIEGIPIASPQVTTTRTTDVASHAIIVQSKDNKEYRVDNAVPKPRQWQVEGYLRTMTAADQLFVIRPTLSTQERQLDLYATSRRPCWFKDDYNRFYRVQITSFISQHDAASTNTSKVSLTLQEYKPLMVDNQIAGRKLMTLRGAVMQAAQVVSAQIRGS